MVDLSSGDDGTSIEIGTADPVPEGSLTLMLAGRLDELPVAGDYANMITKRDTYDSADMRWQWSIQQPSSSNQFEFTSDADYTFFTLPPSTGYHVWILTDDGTDSIIYEDGIIHEKLSATTLTFGDDTAAGLRIGNGEALGGFDTENFNGLIDVVAMWDRAITPGEAAALGANPYLLFDPRGGKLGIARR
jgi:hypothetical protein